MHARDCEGRTPLHLAARWNENPESSFLLLERGAELDATDEDGNTPHELARKNPSRRPLMALEGVAAGRTA